MADGVTIDNGGLTDFTAATDDCGGSGHVAIVKLAYSADGVATLVTADSSGLEVQLGAALPAGTNAIGKLAANSGVDIGDVDVTTVIPGTGATNLGKAIDSAAGATDTGVAPLAIRDNTLSTLTPAEGDWAPLRVDTDGALWVQLSGALAASTDSIALGTVAGQGYTPQQFIDVDESEDEVKGSAGTLHSIIATNNAASARFLKVYDGTAAGVSVGSTTPKWTIQIPAGAGFVWESAIGIAMSTGITIAATTGVAVADTGAPSANDVVVSVGYK